MQKTVLSFLVFLMLNWNANSQTNFNEQILKEAHLYASAIKKNHFKEVVSHIYPVLVSKLGGKDSLYVKTSNKMVLLKKEGLRYKSIEFGKLSNIIKTDVDLWYAVLPQTITQINSQGKIVTETFLFVISTTQGKTWFFVEEEQFHKHKKTLFKQMKMEVAFPERNQRFIKNKSFTSFKKPN